MEQTASARCFGASVQFALNLPRDNQNISERTVDSYRQLEPVYEQQKRMETMPEILLADTDYGSQAHVEMSAEIGVTLVSPAPSGKMDRFFPLTIRRRGGVLADDFGG